jgi:NAD(P)-dependent dehydrogenase (short-subunit alcohol dehydrogenase family)
MTTQFGATSTTDDVLAGIDLTGKTVLVTGVSAGLGVETARVLSAHGAKVVGTARDVDKAQRALSAAGAKADVVEMDLASLASIRAATDALAARTETYDVLIANAGVMATPQGTTEDGFETQFGTNHLGHFLFVNRMVPCLAPKARVVVLSSAGHRFANVDLADPGFATTAYEPFLAYGRSKTANALFALEFDRRHRASGLRAAAVHPGRIMTELGRHMPPGAMDALLAQVNAARGPGDPPTLIKTVPQGAATSVWAGFIGAADAVGGRYCEDCRVAFPADPSLPFTSGVLPHASDPESAKALWTLSEKLVGETF